MKLTPFLPLLMGAVACSSAGSADSSLPYHTTFTKVGDTVVASTTGDVPDTLLRRLVLEWRTAGDSTKEPLGDVGAIAVAADGRVWVWDPATPALWLFDADGTPLRQVSRRGRGPGEYERVNDLAIARDGALVMWDDGNARLNIYNSDGGYRTSAHLSFSDCCGLPVVIDTLNRIWLNTHPRMVGGKGKPFDPADWGKPADVGYFRYDSSGAPIDTILAPSLPGADGVLTALQVTASSIGGMSQHVPYGTYPLYAASPLGHVVSALSRPYTVNSEANGKPARLVREFMPVPVAEAERAQRRANIEFRMRRAKSDFTWNGPDIPREKPPINDLAVGLDGRIWVQLSVPSEEFEPGPQASGAGPFPDTRGPPPPPIKFRPKEKRWDVFEPDGRYLGRIVVPRELSLYVMRGNLVWGVTRDADDVPMVVRMRIDPGM
jgi:6-bladed beta-propeller protein